MAIAYVNATLDTQSMNHIRLLSGVLIYIAVTLPIQSEASDVFAVDDPIFGIGSLTHDAIQQLHFLDLTFTTNRSFNSISDELGAGGEFEGFRFANEAEVIQLVNHYGFSPAAVESTNVIGDTGADQLSGLVALLGQTALGLEGGTGLEVRQSIGFTSTPAGLGIREVGLSDYVLHNTRNDAVLSGFAERVDETGAQNFRGSFLVRHGVVPEPTSLVIGCALIALSIATRRRLQLSWTG